MLNFKEDCWEQKFQPSNLISLNLDKIAQIPRIKLYTQPPLI